MPEVARTTASVPRLTVYYKATCRTCQRVLQQLDQRRIPVRRREYFQQPLTRGELTRLLRKLGLPPRQLLRARDPLYKELQRRQRTEAELIDLILKHPSLLRRPILERAERAALADRTPAPADLLH